MDVVLAIAIRAVAAAKDVIRVVAVHADAIRVSVDRVNVIHAAATPALAMLVHMVQMTLALMTIHAVAVGGSLAVAITIRRAERVIMAAAVCSILLVMILAARESGVKTEILSFPAGWTRGSWGMGGTRRITSTGR